MEKRRLWEQETENVRMKSNADGKRFVRRGSRTGKLLGLAVLTASMLPLAPVCAAAPDAAVSDDQTDNAQAAAGDYSQVASDSEKVTPQEVGIPGMTPITADDVADGTYEVTVESSSSMFRIEKAELTVQDGQMSAVLTLGGTGYLKLYMGTGAEAAAADPADYIDYEENAEGQYTYLVPVEALDMPVDCAAFSKKKEKWYDRQILFEAKSLPAEAVLTELPDYDALEKAARDARIQEMKDEKATEEAQEAEANMQSTGLAAEHVDGTAVDGAGGSASGMEDLTALDLSDGIYSVEVSLEGGSGRATVTSPTQLFVADGAAKALVEWSSSNYDYMIVGGERYLPLDGYDQSAFLIPVEKLGESLEVVADTTAMSVPHEIAYTLTFDGGSLIPLEEQADTTGNWILLVLAVCICAVAFVKTRRK